MPRRIFRSRANQFAAEPGSQARMQFSGSRGDSSQNTRCGLIGLALTMARSSSVCHHVSTFFSICSRHERSFLRSSSGSSSRSVAALSPIRLTSIG